MLQPFVLLEEKHIERLEKLKKTILVTQTYTRGANHLLKQESAVDILITDYSAKGPAEIHYNALRNTDKYGAMMYLTKTVHKEKLMEMLEGRKYRLYWSVIESEQEVLKILDAYYKPKVRDFISQKTTWRVAGNDQVVVDGIEVVFGELFVQLKWRTQKKRVELSEIEKY